MINRMFHLSVIRLQRELCIESAAVVSPHILRDAVRGVVWKLLLFLSPMRDNGPLRGTTLQPPVPPVPNGLCSGLGEHRARLCHKHR